MPEKLKVIIDTNLWISFLLSRKFDFIDNLLRDEKVQLVFCYELFAELTEVANRPKFSKFFSNAEWQIIMDIIGQYAIYVNIKSNVQLCRDEKDDFLLSLAQDADADYLITGDADLLDLKTVGKTQIVTMTEFQKVMS